MIKRIITSSLLRNFSVLVGSTIITQTINFIFSPLIARIYGPTLFGVQGIFLAIVSIFSPFSNLRYSMAIVIAKNFNEIRYLSYLSVFISCGISISAMIILFLFRGRGVENILGTKSLGMLIYFLPITILFCSFQEITEYISVRLSVFRTLAIVIVAQIFIFNLSKILIGLIFPTAATLVIMISCSYGIQALMTWIRIKNLIEPISNIHNSSLMEVLYKYREFPLYRFSADLINGVTQSFPVFFLSIFFSPMEVGFYTIARSVVNFPLSIIGSASGNVLYSRMAEMDRNKIALFPFVLKMTLIYLLIPGSGIGFIWVISPYIFSIVFGDIWRPSGIITQWMSLWVIWVIVNIPSVRALPIIKKQKMHLLFNIFIMIGGGVGMLIGYSFYKDVILSVKYYSLTVSMLYLMQIILYLYEIYKYDNNIE